VEKWLNKFQCHLGGGLSGFKNVPYGWGADHHTVRDNFWGGYVAAHRNKWEIYTVAVLEHVKQ